MGNNAAKPCKLCRGAKIFSILGGITHPCPECKGVGYIVKVDDKLDSGKVEETIAKTKQQTLSPYKLKQRRKIAKRFKESCLNMANDIDQTLSNS